MVFEVAPEATWGIELHIGDLSCFLSSRSIFLYSILVRGESSKSIFIFIFYYLQVFLWWNVEPDGFTVRAHPNLFLTGNPRVTTSFASYLWNFNFHDVQPELKTNQNITANVITKLEINPVTINILLVFSFFIMISTFRYLVSYPSTNNTHTSSMPKVVNP